MAIWKLKMPTDIILKCDGKYSHRNNDRRYRSSRIRQKYPDKSYSPELYPDVTIIDQSLFAASARPICFTYLGISDIVRKLLHNLTMFQINSSAETVKEPAKL